MLRFRLREFLEEHEISAYRLGLNVPDLDAQTIYHYVRGSRTPSLKGLDAVIRGLRLLTGKPVQIVDLLEYISDDEFGSADEQERQGWTIISLNGNHNNKTSEIGAAPQTSDFSHTENIDPDAARNTIRRGALRFKWLRRRFRKRLRKRLFRLQRRLNSRTFRGVRRR
ncbi:MAG: hypothetical protein U5L04_06150 [Trueperaceae bacterium]|nr:hypothetical protein [Trueperaceae bacterium]